MPRHARRRPRRRARARAHRHTLGDLVWAALLEPAFWDDDLMEFAAIVYGLEVPDAVEAHATS